MNYLALDPGDRWIGVATLQFSFEKKKASISFGATCLDRKDRSIGETMDDVAGLVGLIDAHRLVVEDYQIRQVGFNSFNAGQTLRLLGALQYQYEENKNVRLALVKPDSPTLAQQFWRHLWDDIRGTVDRHVPREQRQHAYSAWRVLGAYLMSNELETLQRIHQGS